MKAQELFKGFKLLIKEYGENYHNFRDEDLFALWFLRAYVIENGRIVGQGTGQDLLSFESVRTAYLG